MHFGRALIAVQLLFVAALSTLTPNLQLPQTQQAACCEAFGSLTPCPTAGAENTNLPAPPASVTSIWGGARSSILLKSDGTVWDFGFNWFGKLGDGTVSIGPDYSNDRHTPIEVHGAGNAGYLNSIKAIMGGESHNFALKNDGTVWAWGWNKMHQLGDGTTIDRYTPVQVSGLTSIIALGGRGYHSLALKSDGTVWAWGWNTSGQLGDGTILTQTVPVQVVGLLNPAAITGGGFFSLALMPDHTLRAWGRNQYGQLGDKTTVERHSPVPVDVTSGLTNTIGVSAGWFHAVALSWDHTVWTWGDNKNGRLGDGSTNNSSVPVYVSGLSDVIQVSAGDCSTAALKSDGTVWTWGCNESGELGDGTFTERPTPVQVKGLTGVIAIAARDYHNLAIKSDGSVWGWGADDHGQLGDNATSSGRNTPVQVIFLQRSIYMPFVLR